LDVSFIIPLYNCLPLTQAMLASLQATLPPDLPHEIILVDDGSTDGTREWLGTLRAPPFRVVLNEKNLGFAAANNRGAALAAGRRLVLLNNDLVLTPGWWEPLLQAQASIPNPGLIGNVQLRVATGAIDHAGIRINARAKPEHDRTLPPHADRKEVIALTGACMLTETSLWRELGGFDAEFVNGCEDVDLCFKARQAGRTNLVALRSVIYHHVSASPGRKRRDEANTRRLMLRWRKEIVGAGLDAWCRRYFECDLNAARGFFEPLTAAKIGCYVMGWAKRPPPGAAAGLHAVIDRELAHWRAVLD
jgi:GT2 family glycosyltransferase